MKYIYLFLILFSVGFAYQRDNSTVIIQPQPYPQYQPDNGPMRGPNSLEAHKYGADYWMRDRDDDEDYYVPYREYRPYRDYQYRNY